MSDPKFVPTPTSGTEPPAYVPASGEHQHEGLPVAGYVPQSDANVVRVNANKQLEEQVLRQLDALDVPGIDRRWLAVARTHIEIGFMAANRAVFQPQRIALSADAQEPR
ncbi:MAG: hypothetical protein AB7U62_09305 [Pseudolabrys sp.]